MVNHRDALKKLIDEARKHQEIFSEEEVITKSVSHRGLITA